MIKKGEVYQAQCNTGTKDFSLNEGMYYMSFKDGTLRVKGKDREINTDYFVTERVEAEIWTKAPECCTFLDYHNMMNDIECRTARESFLNLPDEEALKIMKKCHDKNPVTFAFNTYYMGRKEMFKLIRNILK